MILSFSFTNQVLAESESTVIKEYQERNTYVLANEKNINTTINGDLFLLTSKSKIQGTINKDLNAISGILKIQGIIGDDLRIISADAELNVYVFNEFKAITDKINISNTTVINGITKIKASRAHVRGTYNDDFIIDADTVHLEGTFKKNVEINSKRINIKPETTIFGNLKVPEGTPVPDNVVSGEINFFIEEIQPLKLSDIILPKIILFLVIVLLALVINFFTPQKIETFLTATNKKPLLSLVIGFVSAILIPIIALIFLISIVTAPIGALLLLGYASLLILSLALGALLTGKQVLGIIRPRREPRLEMLIGALIIVVLSFIPGFLFLIVLLYFSLFLGTIIIKAWPFKKKKQPRKKK